MRLPSLQDPHGHEGTGPCDLSGGPGPSIQIHGDVQIDQGPFRAILVRVVDDDDIPGRHILVEDSAVLKERSVRLHRVPKDLYWLEGRGESVERPGGGRKDQAGDYPVLKEVLSLFCVLDYGSDGVIFLLVGSLVNVSSWFAGNLLYRPL